MLYVVSKYFLEKIVNFVIQGIDTSKNFCKHIFPGYSTFYLFRQVSKVTDQSKFQDHRSDQVPGSQGHRSRQLSLKITD